MASAAAAWRASSITFSRSHFLALASARSTASLRPIRRLTRSLSVCNRAFPGSDAWTADSGAIYDLRSNALRPSTWTSADAAGLPIVPGLVTVDEVLSGEIKHAIRFTVPQTRREFVWPARHYASTLTGTQYPRMGERFRLKASYDISSYPSDMQVILRAMKKYGIILADNGSAWYISGKPDPRWNDTNLRSFSRLLGENFEAVDATVLRIDVDPARSASASVTISEK